MKLTVDGRKSLAHRRTKENRRDTTRDGYLLEISSFRRKYIESMNEIPIRMRQRRGQNIYLMFYQVNNLNKYFICELLKFGKT